VASYDKAHEEIQKVVKKALADLILIAANIQNNDFGKVYMAVVGGFQVVFWTEYNLMCKRIADEIAKNHAEAIKGG